MEALIWIRSIAIVLLIVAHALRHVHNERPEGKDAPEPASPSPPLVVTPELLDGLRALLAQTTISGGVTIPRALPSPQDEQEASEGEQEVNNYERVKAYLADHPNAKVRDVAEALTISVSTADKWMIRIKGKRSQE